MIYGWRIALSQRLERGRSEARGEAHSIGYACLVTILGKANRFGPMASRDAVSTFALIRKLTRGGGSSMDFSKFTAVYSAAVERNRAHALLGLPSYAFQLPSTDSLFIFLYLPDCGCNLLQSHFCLAQCRLLRLHMQSQSHSQGLSRFSSI